MSVSYLSISKNQRYLVQEDGTPFFWLADTAWELFHRLSTAEVEHYLKRRAKQKFNVIQAVALAELDGLTKPNAYGRTPLKKNKKGNYDPTLPDLEGDYSYWDHVDHIIGIAKSLGLYIALLPTWGDKFHLLRGKGPAIFDAENAYHYGKWIGRRYADQKNIIWVLGGDRPLATKQHFDIINSMALGIKEINPRHLMTFHPKGGESSSYHVHHEDWLDFNMVQSSHGDGPRTNYKLVTSDYHMVPVKPTLDAEPCYEGHPRGFNPDNSYFDDVDVRQAAYYSVFSGGFGHTYGHHSIWSMCPGQFSTTEFTELGAYFIMDWQDALSSSGAQQMGHLVSLIELTDMLERVPDQDLLAKNYTGSNYMVATRGQNTVLVYCPCGLEVTILLERIEANTINGKWFNPRDGSLIGIGVINNNGEQKFIPPTSGRGQDWILVLQWNEDIQFLTR